MFSRSSSTLLTRRGRFALKTCAALVSASFSVGACLHAVPLPHNLAFGLRELAGDYQAARPTGGATTLSRTQVSKILENYHGVRADDENRVMVDVYLDGTKPIADVVKACEALGCTITARVDWYRQGALSMYLPLDKAANLGETAGVDGARLSTAPRHRVGRVTSGGAKVLKSDLVNATGYLGAGITVGAMSDSFDTAKAITSSPPLTTAAVDEGDDDLPGPGSAYNTNVPYVLLDYGTATRQGTDEGRAMCQIIHDVAPAANIAFATGDVSEVGFAQNIVALATPTTTNITIPASKYTTPAPVSPATTVTRAGGGCQVICDDLGYGDEPFFSDGILSQAVDNVTRNYGVTYFSSAGNDGNSGYAATYNPQTNNAVTQALLLSEGGITYTGIGTGTTETNVIESYHSFGTNAAGQPILVQKVMVPTLNGSNYGGSISFQWNDPDALVVGGVKQVSTDYDILTFSVNTTTGVATYQSRMSGVGSNFSTNVPEENPSSVLSAGTQYEFVLVRTNRAANANGPTRNVATQIRWSVDSDASTIVADFVTPSSPNTVGHPCAATCIGTAAYVYDKTFNYLNTPYQPEVENYSSNGPAIIYFDSAGNRLATPITRKQPTLSTVDGVDTSFFGYTSSTNTGDSDGNAFPNFFGTSAASPHGAGCAALLLNAAKANSITLTPTDVRQLLVSTTQGTQDQNPALATTPATSATNPVQFSTFSRGTFSDPDAYTIVFNGAAGSQLTSLVYDLTPINCEFVLADYPITTGLATTGTIPTAPTISSSMLSNLVGTSTTSGKTETLNFSNFNSGDTISFGVCTANLTYGVFEFGGDDLSGGTFTATVTNADTTTSTYTGTLSNTFSRKWSYKSGYGLVDVNAAVNRLLGH